MYGLGAQDYVCLGGTGLCMAWVHRTLYVLGAQDSVWIGPTGLCISLVHRTIHFLGAEDDAGGSLAIGVLIPGQYTYLASTLAWALPLSSQ